jgi:hypothetical protein
MEESDNAIHIPCFTYPFLPTFTLITPVFDKNQFKGTSSADYNALIRQEPVSLTLTAHLGQINSLRKYPAQGHR